jgi:uncharacterized protein DUF4491
MNPTGAVAALTAFAAIWFGHVAVRKIEYASPTIRVPAALFFFIGFVLEWVSLASRARATSTVLGILGITLVWDALELTRQQRRVRNGHAPANPRNPRHAALLTEPGSRATSVNLLKREPVGERIVKSTRTGRG